MSPKGLALAWGALATSPTVPPAVVVAVLGARAERLRHQVRLDDLESAIAVTVDDALRPSASGLWIRPVSSRTR